MGLFNNKTAITNDFDIVGIGDGSIIMGDGTRYVFFRVQPINLNVLPETSIYGKVKDLSDLMQAMGELQIVCLDARENFTDNKKWIEKRIKEEAVPEIRSLLEKELRYVKKLEAESTTSRQFLFVLKLKMDKESLMDSELQRFQQLATQSMISLHKLNKEEIKDMIAVFFHADTNSDFHEDVDGASYYADVDFNELSKRLASGEFSEKVAEFDLDNLTYDRNRGDD